MIHVQIMYQEQSIQTIAIRGHAFAGDPGFDLVCAGVSAIGTGMLNALDRLFPDLVDLTLIDDHDPLIRVEIKQSNESLQLVLQAFITQLETIQVSYADAIHISRRNTQ